VKKEKEKKKVPMEWSSAVHKSSLVLYATISSSKSGMVKRWQFNDGNYYTCQYYLVKYIIKIHSVAQLESQLTHHFILV
jgi:hypothetical protein